jgi:hypothetical protein
VTGATAVRHRGQGQYPLDFILRNQQRLLLLDDSCRVAGIIFRPGKFVLNNDAVNLVQRVAPTAYLRSRWPGFWQSIQHLGAWVLQKSATYLRTCYVLPLPSLGVDSKCEVSHAKRTGLRNPHAENFWNHQNILKTAIVLLLCWFIKVPCRQLPSLHLKHGVFAAKTLSWIQSCMESGLYFGE